MEKKRVDVKETRNLAKNKGREKKDGRKNGTRIVILTTARASGWRLQAPKFQFGPIATTKE